MEQNTKKAMSIPNTNKYPVARRRLKILFAILPYYFHTQLNFNMKNLIVLCLMALLSQAAFSQQPAATATPQNAQFKVLGNCGMCKKTIEKAALGAGATTAMWDMNTDMLAVTFDEKKTTTDAIQKAVAKAGYDNAGYKADDKAYGNLAGCCQYDRTGAAGGTKSCTENR